MLLEVEMEITERNSERVTRLARGFLWITLATLAAPSLHASNCAPQDTCVVYPLNFLQGSGTHLPTGTFTQDLTYTTADVISISWNGFSFTFNPPASLDLFYNLQQYSMFDPNQAAVLAACSGANYSEEELKILEGCGGTTYTVIWEGQGLASNGFTTWRFYLGYPGGGGDNEFALAFGSDTDPLITEIGAVSINPVTTSGTPEPRALIPVLMLIGLGAVMRKHIAKRIQTAS